MPRTRSLVDHPARLGRLAPIFDRRRIAMAADTNGRVVLVRPDSVVVDVGATDDALARLRAVVAKLFPDSDRELVSDPGDGGTSRVELPGVTTRRIAGERRWSVLGPPDGEGNERSPGVRTVLATLWEAGLAATANHVLQGSQTVKGSPVGTSAQFAGGVMFTAEVIQTNVGSALKSTVEPAIAPAFHRPALGLPAGKYARPQVLVLDTGLRTKETRRGQLVAEHPVLTCARTHSPWERDPTIGAIDDEDEYDDDGSGTIDFEAGHGTFITGIIQQICPDAEVHVGGALSSFGDGDVATVIATFEHVLAATKQTFDIVVLSLGGYMSDDDGELLGAALDRLLGERGVGIAAAGNQAAARPYYPAACDDIVAVGALGQGDKAWFTNFGGWVDACAPGVDVVSTFFLADPAGGIGPEFDGWARWSGTSFSAPKVAGAVAQEMYLTQSSAREAWERLSDYQRYRFPDLGIVFNV